MNSASTNFEKYLTDLRQRLQHPTDYELALTAILGRIVSQMLPGATDRLAQPAIFRLGGHPFIHGNAVIGQRALVFIFFPEINTGVAALIPGAQGAMEVARFKTPGGVPRPGLN